MTVRNTNDRCALHGAKLWVDPRTGDKYCPMPHPGQTANVLSLDARDAKKTTLDIKQAPEGVYGKEKDLCRVMDARRMVNDAVAFSCEYTVTREGSIRNDMVDALAVAYKEIAALREELDQRTTVWGWAKSLRQRFTPKRYTPPPDDPMCVLCKSTTADNYMGLSDGSLVCSPNCEQVHILERRPPVAMKDGVSPDAATDVDKR